MKSKHTVRVAGAFLIVGTLLFFAGCGFKNDPVPPETVVPVAIDDLRYSIDESGVTLSWTFPDRTIGGKDIVDISSFDLYRAVMPLKDYCATCPIPFTKLAEIPGGVTSDEGRRRVGDYRASLLRSRHMYFYKLRARNSWWADSADSNVISFVWNVPASAPESVIAKPDDSRIILQWEPVTTLIDSRPVESEVSYQVLRSTGGKQFVPVGKPVAVDKYIDRPVVNGQKYFYKVQAQQTVEGYLVEGGISEVVDATPVDKTPPLPPTGVKAVRTATGVRVFWDRPDDPQVMGYRVYRRFSDQKTPELMGELSVDFTMYADNDVPEDKRAYYSITAIDQSKPANESDPSKEATTR